MIDVSHPFPLRDGHTVEAGAVVRRKVIAELGIPEPYVMESDDYVRTPLRVSHNMASGFVLEVGDLDFSEHDFLELEGAVAEMRRVLDSSESIDECSTNG